MVEPRRARARRRLRRRRAARAARRSRGVDGARHRTVADGVNDCVAKGLSVIQGDADTDLVDYPDDAFDYVILSQTLQATRRPRVVLEQCCASAGGPSCRSRISATGASALQLAVRRPHAGDREPAGLLVRHARTSTSAPSATSATCATTIGAKIERALALDALRDGRCGSTRRGGSGICSASRRCSC